MLHLYQNIKFPLDYQCKVLHVTFHNTKKKNYIFYFLNIFENNFYMVKKEQPAEKDTIFYLYVR